MTRKSIVGESEIVVNDTTNGLDTNGYGTFTMILKADSSNTTFTVTEAPDSSTSFTATADGDLDIKTTYAVSSSGVITVTANKTVIVGYVGNGRKVKIVPDATKSGASAVVLKTERRMAD